MFIVIVLAVVALIAGGTLVEGLRLAAAQARMGVPDASGGMELFLILVVAACCSGIIVIVCNRLSRSGREAALISDGDYRKCPACAELVKAEAKICKHCHTDLASLDRTQAPAQPHSETASSLSQDVPELPWPSRREPTLRG